VTTIFVITYHRRSLRVCASQRPGLNRETLEDFCSKLCEQEGKIGGVNEQCACL